MRLPELNELSTSREMVDVFGGYNHNLRIGEGEFYDMQNLTSDGYPVLSVRKKRGIVKKINNYSGIISKGKLAYLDGTSFVYGKKVHLMPELKPGDKTLIPFGAYIIILPDKIQYNTQDGTWEKLDARFESSGKVTFEMCNVESVTYNYVASATAPPDPENGQYWLDLSTSPHSIKVYSTSTSQWASVATAYVKISNTGIDEHFELYDGIKISGCTATGTEDLNGSAVVWAKGQDYIVVIGVIPDVVTQDDVIIVERTMPEMEYITESENRLWGCHYGIVDGEPVNELYACKLGDAKNWNCFMNTSQDSYVVSVGTDGAFTGAVTHLGYPLFFKENCIHKVYGNYPANYQVQTTNCRGVQEGSSKSLAMVNEILYYKSTVDVCAYDGSLPTSVSSALGTERYTDAVAGSNGSKYYISMKDTAGKWNMFAYDTSRRVWHREDDTQAKAFCCLGTDLYFVDAGNILTTVSGALGDGIIGAEGKLEGDLKWYAETGVIGYSNPDNKYISKLNIRMTLDLGSTVDLYIQYDSSGNWEHKWSMNGVGTKSFMIPIIPRRCDHLRIKLVGKGDCKIFSVSKVLESGSDM